MKPVAKKALEAFQQWGKAGGERRAKSLPAARRQAISRQAAQARWEKQKSGAPFMPSVRLEKAAWDDPVYLEEVLSHGTLKEWGELHKKIADRPFGAEAYALEKVLAAADIYGATKLWKGILGSLQGKTL